MWVGIVRLEENDGIVICMSETATWRMMCLSGEYIVPGGGGLEVWRHGMHSSVVVAAKDRSVVLGCRCELIGRLAGPSLDVR